jgi:hypothetical protein
MKTSCAGHGKQHIMDPYLLLCYCVPEYLMNIFLTLWNWLHM